MDIYVAPPTFCLAPQWPSHFFHSRIATAQTPQSSRYKKGFVSQFVLLRFRQEDVRQNVVVTTLSQ